MLTEAEQQRHSYASAPPLLYNYRRNLTSEYVYKYQVVPIINCSAFITNNHAGIRRIKCYIHGVQGFFSSRLNWDPPTITHPQASVSPPPLVPREGETHSTGGGGRGSKSDERTNAVVLYSTVYSYIYEYVVRTRTLWK